MNIIFVLIPLSLVLLGLAVWAFFWAVRSRQFENLEVEAWRIVMDDDAPRGGSGGEPASGDGQEPPR
jgi:cbb3-type cytochrome oxidase maturation protein